MRHWWDCKCSKSRLGSRREKPESCLPHMSGGGPLSSRDNSCLRAEREYGSRINRKTGVILRRAAKRLGRRGPADHHSVWDGVAGHQHRGEREEQVYYAGGRQRLGKTTETLGTYLWNRYIGPVVWQCDCETLVHTHHPQVICMHCNARRQHLSVLFTPNHPHPSPEL